MHYFKVIVAYIAGLFICFGTVAAVGAQEVAAEVAGPAVAVPPWAPALVPMLTFAVQWFFANVVPNTLIVKIRDEFLPLIAILVGTLSTSAVTGEVNWSQGPFVGLAGVGIHQLWRQLQKAA